mgnify:CR=1 FL=1
MTAAATPDAARLVFAAVAGLILLLVLIIKFKVHAMISILVGAVAIGLIGGMPLADIISSVNEGIGNTLKGIALLVGLGSMFGAILEESGGAQTLAVTMVRRFGDEKAAWALGITGLVIAMPVFFDAGLIIMIPLVLIILNSVTKVVPAMAGIQPVLAFLGEPFMALLLATIAAMYLLGTRHGYTNAQLEKIMTKSLEPTGMILLVTACGGVLRYVLQNSGLGDVIGGAVVNANLPLVLVAFIVAALVRISVGSATVAMTMAAGIISAMPGISELSPPVPSLRHRCHRRRFHRVLPLQRLRLLAGQEPGGHGRKDHAQDLDHHGNAGGRCRRSGSTDHLLL